MGFDALASIWAVYTGNDAAIILKCSGSRADIATDDGRGAEAAAGRTFCSDICKSTL